MFIVEGNIGAGKSTFLKVLDEHISSLTTLCEPVDSWHGKRSGASLLHNFIHNPERWAYTMETFAMMKRVEAHMADQKRTEPFVIVERSVYSGHYVFSCNGYQQGFLSEKEWQMYTTFFNYLVQGHCKPPRGFIYLRLNPDVAHARIAKRSREGESSIPHAYLTQVHQRHEDFLIRKKDILPELQDVPVLVIDVNKEFESDNLVSQEIAQRVLDFLLENTDCEESPCLKK